MDDIFTIEGLINRASLSLRFGASEETTRANLRKSGHSDEVIDLLIAAAKILNKDRDEDTGVATNEEW